MQNYSSLQENHDQEEQGILFHVAEPTRSKWNHIEDLDSFFSRMYKYHQKHGFICMLLQEIFELNQFIFVVFLTAYLIHGIDYQLLFGTTGPGKKLTLGDIMYPLDKWMENFTGLTWFILMIAAAVFLLKFLTRCYQIIYFWDIKQFYNTALNIEDCNLDNLTWHEIQTKIKLVQLEQQMCIHKRELTELDIYHRILRQENYLVAMVNKHLLPPRMNIPFLGEVVYWTKGLRYNMQSLFFWSPWSPFENPWHLREEYKRQNLRTELAQQLGRQILWLALINLILAPIIFIWQILYTMFSYGEVIKREPGQMGTRCWSVYSKMYLRHFNELDHELHARLTRAYLPASKYLSAFSSPTVTVIAQYVGFLCGSLFTVIVALTIYDEDVLGVEHVLTLMTGLGGMTAICRGLIPDETLVWCPEQLLQCVVMHTHYLPAGWRGQAHTSKIREEFQQLFQMRVVAVMEDLLSPILTPYLMWRWVYPRSLDIVDFFRNFTVSVVGVGDVCSFAQMDIKKNGNPEWQTDSLISQTESAPPDQYSQAQNGKIELSLVHFTTTNPSWVPPPEAAQFVESVQDEAEPMFDSIDERNMFASFADLSQSATATSLDRKKTMGLKSIADPASVRQLGAFKQSVSMVEGPNVFGPVCVRTSAIAEGPSVYGPICMRTSALTLHDRHYRQATKYTRSLEETTPLLTPKTTSSLTPKH